MAGRTDPDRIAAVLADRDMFAKSLLNEDDLGAVVRGHTYLHEYLIRALQTRLPHPEALRLDSGRVTFSALVGQARAYGIVDEDLYEALKAVGQLRNGFAHELDRQLSGDDVASMQTRMKGRVGDLFQEVTGGSTPGPRRLRHMIWAIKLAMEEVATGRKYRLWRRPFVAALQAGISVRDNEALLRYIRDHTDGDLDLFS
jgi:hypothetical protein